MTEGRTEWDEDMLSLSFFQSKEELQAFFERCQKTKEFLADLGVRWEVTRTLSGRRRHRLVFQDIDVRVDDAGLMSHWLIFVGGVWDGSDSGIGYPQAVCTAAEKFIEIVNAKAKTSEKALEK
jgi:hypothetical protein